MEKLKTNMTASSKKSPLVGHDKKTPNKISLATKNCLLPILSNDGSPKVQQQPFFSDGLGGDTAALGRLPTGTEKEQRNMIDNQSSPYTAPISLVRNQDDSTAAYTQVRINAIR